MNSFLKCLCSATCIFMCVVFCSCPNEIQGDTGPIVVAKMNNDYSKNAYIDKKDSSMRLHYAEDAVKLLCDSFYELSFNSAFCQRIAFVSVLGSELQNGNNYLSSTDDILDYDPIKELYYYEEEDIDKLKKIIKNRDLGKLKRIK